ncbi:MAG: hypothetical protein ABWZ82_09880 [Candidatus Limnocylindrales bacterium]
MTTGPSIAGDADAAPSQSARLSGAVARDPGPSGATMARTGLLGRLRPFPFHPVLLAAYPVLFLFAQNLAEVGVGETYQPILRAATVAIGITLLAGLLLRDLRRGALIASAVVVIWFAYGYIEDLARPLAPSRDVLLGACLVVLLAVALLAWRLRPGRIAALTTAVNVVALLLVAMTLIDIVPHQLSRGTIAASATGTDRPVAAPGSRDIWFLVFDRYGNEVALGDVAGVDNDLPEWLEAQGFTVVRDAHANYGRTAMSLAATLNMTSLDDLATAKGPDSDDAEPFNEMLQDHEVGRFLQDHGYRYVHIGSWWAPTKTNRIADENPVLSTQSDFGTLLDDTTLSPTMDEVLGTKAPPKHHLLHRAGALFDWNELDRVSDEPGPKFVFGHILLPHEPYVFKANGEYSELSEEDSRFSGAGFAAQLAYTNDRIRGLVSKLLAVPEAERPIIVIAADEGPYPERYNRDQVRFDWSQATDEEIATKFGVLQAMYLPGDAPADAPAPYPGMSVINTFPILFDRYFGEDIPLSPDRSYASRTWARPYDLIDVTGRLRAATP